MMVRSGIQRRGFLIAAAATGAVAAGGARAQSGEGSVQTDNAPKELAGKAMPEPSPSQSSGPVVPGRGSNLSGKVAVVTGAARGIGRAIAVELAANGADIVAVDIAGPVSPASNAVPASPEELEETAKMIRALGRRAETVRADIRDIAALKRIADQTEQQFGKIDIVVANAAIQRWKPLLEMEDSDWRDVIDNNLNGTANTIRAFAPKMVAKKKG
jgi:FlaA1/EpsC-like NDP-sugar epimerase